MNSTSCQHENPADFAFCENCGGYESFGTRANADRLARELDS